MGDFLGRNGHGESQNYPWRESKLPRIRAYRESELPLARVRTTAFSGRRESKLPPESPAESQSYRLARVKATGFRRNRESKLPIGRMPRVKAPYSES